MKVYDAGSIRNVAIDRTWRMRQDPVGLDLRFAAGAVNRIGRVDEGSTVTDFDEEEVARKHTLSSSLAYAEWQKTKINFIDTPGFANFLTDARSALRVVEAAVLVVDAVAGVEVQTEKPGPRPLRFALPRIVVLNRLTVSAQPRPSTRITTPRLRPRDHPRPATARRGEGVHWRRRPGQDEGPDLRGRRQE